jgi:predicted RNase H-like HicB family nuclease
MTKYPILIGKTKTGYSAHVPDLPGCIATGPTMEATKQLIHDGIGFHLEAMRADGDEIPEPSLIEPAEVE